MVKSQGKVSEESGNFEMEIEWQPCVTMNVDKSYLTSYIFTLFLDCILANHAT